jgi:hypothetical protein
MAVIIDNDLSSGITSIEEDGLTVRFPTAYTRKVWAVSNKTVNSGKWYWEIRHMETSGTSYRYVLVGITNTNDREGSKGVILETKKLYPGNEQFSNQLYANDIRIALDMDNKKLYMAINDDEMKEAFNLSNIDLSLGINPYIGPSYQGTAGNVKFRFNFGATPFKYEMPEGYRPYNEVEEVFGYYSLIKSENKYYDIDLDNNSLVEVPFELESFINSNVNTETIKLTDTSDKLLINSLINPTIASISEPDLMIEISGFRDIRVTTDLDLHLDILSSNEPVVNVKAIPKPQIIISKDNIPIPVNARVMDMNLIATENKGFLRIIFSTDDGVTWNTLNKEELNVINIDVNNLDEVKEKGLNIDDFNNIGWMWDSIIKENKIRFAYYLEIDSEEDKAETKEMNAVFTVISTWKKAKHKKAFNYEYTNTKLIVEIYNDGSYKINYQE